MPDPNQMRQVPNSSHGKTLIAKVLIDCVITVAFLALLSIPLTGLKVHEWLGIALICGIVVHLLLNWAWIVATTRRFLRALPDQVRINYLLNVALFIVMTIVISSGLMISEVALPFLGIHPMRNMFLSMLHLVSADALLLVVGLHLGMNWRWVVSAIRRQIVVPSYARRKRISVGSSLLRSQPRTGNE